MVRIGEDSAERLDVIPPKIQVIRTVRPKYACHITARAPATTNRPAVRMAAAPPALIPKRLASAGLLAFIATAKFCDALPLYRQERQFDRLGVELSRRTMSDSMIAVAAACEPLLELPIERLRNVGFLSSRLFVVQSCSSNVCVLIVFRLTSNRSH